MKQADETTTQLRSVELNFDYGKRVWRVGTRDSELAMSKTTAVLQQLSSSDCDFQYRIVTSGELRNKREWSFGVRAEADAPGVEARLLSEVKMLREALASGDIDFLIEDLSFLPFNICEQARNTIIMPRRDAREVLVLPKGETLASLPPGSAVLAYGHRRAYILNSLRKDLFVQGREHSIYQAFDRVAQKDFAAFVVAADDLYHTDLAGYSKDYSFFPFSAKVFCPAPAQGMQILIGADGLEDASDWRELYSKFDCARSRAAYEAERRIAAILLGNTHDVLRRAAVHVYYDDARVYLTAQNTDSDRQEPKRVDMGLALQGSEQIDEDRIQAAFGSLLGRISFVGAGPGVVDLLTIRGRELIESAEVIIYDNAALTPVLALSNADCEQILLEKKAVVGRSLLPRGEKTARLIMDRARKGLDVVRLCLGDPGLFDIAILEALRLHREQLNYEIVNGVSSVLAGAAFAGVPLTLAGARNSLHIYDGRLATHELFKDRAEPAETLDRLGTLVFLNVVERLPDLCAFLNRVDWVREPECVLVSEAALATQRTLRCPLEQLAAVAVRENVSEPALLILTTAVEEEEAWQWWPRKGIMSGRNLILAKSRPHDPFAAGIRRELELYGANVVELNLLEHSCSPKLAENMDRALRAELEQFTRRRRGAKGNLWLVFTSPSAVESLKDCLQRLAFDVRNLHGIKIAAYGTATLESLQQWGFLADYVPETADMEHMAAGLAADLDKDDKVVQIRGSMSVPVIRVTMQMRGIAYTEIIAYETKTHQQSLGAIMRRLDDADFILFFSPNCVYSFFEGLRMRGFTPTDTAALSRKLIPVLKASANALQARGYALDEHPDKYNVEDVLAYLRDLMDRGEGKNGSL